MVKEPEIITGLKAKFIRTQVQLNVIRIALKRSRNPFHLVGIIRQLVINRRSYLGDRMIDKIAGVDGRYYLHLYMPGWKSIAHNRNIESEVHRVAPDCKKTLRFTNVFLAITGRCPLHCEHCFEWDALNGPDKLTLPELKIIVRRFQEAGTSQIQLTGGEPMLRIDDIIEILKTSGSETDFWLLTSGYKLTIENALKLKRAGLTGVVVSLDHYEPEKHNQFRGNLHAYEWAENAAKASVKANLVTALSLCATNSFVNEANLMSYMNLSRKFGVAFVQILEPQAVGHYKGKDVGLDKSKIKMLEDFYFKMNHDKNYRDFPIVCYHGYFNHHTGCMGVGNRHLYVDTDGDMNPCPFCRKKTGNALSADIEDSARQMQERGCNIFMNT